ncbi:MAG: arsenate reductase ArsC [Phycisphaerales bacterium]
MAERAERARVLFLCTGNSCRSQMAEGWAGAMHGPRVEACSAGTKPTPTGAIDPCAVRVMREAGVNISAQRSKSVAEAIGSDAARPIDLVVTVCDSAAEACPVFAGARRTVHAPFDDPPRLAAGETDDERALAHYRRVRDEIRAFVADLMKHIPPTH